MIKFDVENKINNYKYFVQKTYPCMIKNFISSRIVFVFNNLKNDVSFTIKISVQEK